VNALEHASVAADYRHAEKFAHAEPGLALGDTNLKWYDVAPDDAPVPLAIRAVARRCLRDAARTDELVRTWGLDATQPLPEAPWFPPNATRSARRVFVHIVGETAQHAGHADILREALDGQKTMG